MNQKPDMNQKQATIFITGAASGIGRETALLFARQGWHVGLADVNELDLRGLAARIGAQHCSVHVMDVTDEAAYGRAIDEFAARTAGRIDVLFNNAGILTMGANETIGLARQRRIVDININGVLNGIHLALPYLKRTPGAHIITMCSVSSIYGTPELAVYSATKHAVRALTEALDIELERYGIVVADIIAPYVNTGMVTAASRHARSVAATGVNIQPEQVAALVWRAAHGTRRRWHVHYGTRALAAMFWLLPGFRRPLMKHFCLSEGA